MIKYQIKLLPFPGIALSALLLALLPFVVSFRFLNFQQVATIGETLMPMLGVLLLTPLAFTETVKGRRETLGVRPVRYSKGFAIRLMIQTLLTCVCVSLFIAITSREADVFDKGAMALGLLATAFLYGCLGLTLGHLTQSQSAGYMFPLALFAIEFFTKGKYTARFFTLSLMEGLLRPEKWALLCIGLVGILANVWLSMRQVSVGQSLTKKRLP